jgi:hypothetical protein
MANTFAVTCSAAEYGAFIHTALYSTASGSLEFRDSCATSCSATAATYWIICQTYSSGSPTVVDGLNSTSNGASSFASGIYAASHFVFSLHFCTLSRSGPANCVLFGTMRSGDISCNSVLNHSCRSYLSHVGLVYLVVNTTLSSCIFQGNVFDYFINAYPNCTVTLMRCVLDAGPPNIAYGSLVMVEIIYDKRSRTASGCLMRAPVPSRTASRIPRATRTPLQTRSRTQTSDPAKSPVPTGSPGELSGRTYDARQTVYWTTTFRDCTFRFCQSRSNGAAIHMDGRTYGLGLTGCYFGDCRGTSSGGAIYTGCRWYSMNRTSGWNCTAWSYSGFCYVFLYSTVLGYAQYGDTAATNCECLAGTYYLQSDDHSGGSTTTVQAINSSLNQLYEWASGVGFLNQFGLSMRYCVLEGNRQVNCLYLASLTNSEVSCVTLWNNSCKSYSSYLGLITVEGAWMMNCDSWVCQGNTFDYFIGTYPGGQSGITFLNCVFDMTSLKMTNAIRCSTVNCVYATGRTSLATCHAKVLAGLAGGDEVIINIA